MDEYVALFAVSWMSISPLICFQALLSARDDHQIENHNNNSPTATEVVAPLICILGWLAIALTFVSWKFRTAFEVSDFQLQYNLYPFTDMDIIGFAS